MSDNEEDEDEETLQLRLQAIETQLKLKKLQSRKRDIRSESDHEKDRPPTSRATTALYSNRDSGRDQPLAKSRSASDIQIPLSPDKRKTTVAQEQRSPGRVLLGIDKGLRGRNVSLRRAPSLRVNDDPFIIESSNAGATPGTSLSRHASVGRNRGVELGKSFNERRIESMNRESRETERIQRLEKHRRERKTGFGVKSSEIETLRKTAEAEHEQVKVNQQRKVEAGFSREEVLRAANKPPGGFVQRSNATASVRNSRRERPTQTTDAFQRPRSSASERNYLQERPSSQASSAVSDPSRSSTPVGDPSLFEPYSSSNLSRRYLPHAFLKREFEDKKPILMSKLWVEVKAPDFDIPEEFVMGDMVVFATIANKSQPFTHKDPHRTQTHDAPAQTSLEQANTSRDNDRGKYMVLKLVDLKFPTLDLDLFLFSSAYTRWSKLTPGTVIAILNPDIMPPPKHKKDTNRWSLTLNSSEDTILEIGTNKDIGWCKAVKKDGQQCSDWVDKRKTEYCEFHINAGVERIRRGRMEVQGMGAGYAPGGKKGGQTGMFGSGRRGGGGGEGSKSGSKHGGRRDKDDGLIREGKQYDRGAHSAYFMAPNFNGRSAASLLDADEEGNRGGRGERIRRALAEKEREREIGRQLGSIGGGPGAEYLRGSRRSEQKKSGNEGASEMEMSRSEPRDARSLGLRGNKADEVSLGMLKRKRSETLGGAKKKTRFVTEKGIREAGRESLPGPADIELDDGLEII